MNEITRHSRPVQRSEATSTQDQGGAFVERLRAKFRAESPGSLPEFACLLLDVSGSMSNLIGASERRIDALAALAGNFKNVRRFVFHSTCEELGPTDHIGEPRGGTSMHAAFLHVKRAGITHVVMITDGRPDSQSLALEASKGLRIDVFYVGPDPAPSFLQDLARQTGGTYGRASLDARPALESKIRRLLTSPTSGKEPIKL